MGGRPLGIYRLWRCSLLGGGRTQEPLIWYHLVYVPLMPILGRVSSDPWPSSWGGTVSPPPPTTYSFQGRAGGHPPMYIIFCIYI